MPSQTEKSLQKDTRPRRRAFPVRPETGLSRLPDVVSIIKALPRCSEMERNRTPVGRAVFKTVERRRTSLVGSNSRSFPPYTSTEMGSLEPLATLKTVRVATFGTNSLVANAPAVRSPDHGTIANIQIFDQSSDAAIRMIVGTAGHIDHGKTLLVEALTGVATDRLKEERERGISIELGFAYVPVPETETVEKPAGDVLGFVDVPGHERFVHTMMAGAAGIDFALVVVAADDGVMPQTREHLQILDLLGIRQGVVALNKIDLVDAGQLRDVEVQIRDLLADTSLAGIDILEVSAAMGTGVADLKQRLMEEAASRPQLPVRGKFRMAIDRSFTLRGAGTVVTGAVRSGSIRAGEKVRLLPACRELRVRSLHSQGRASDIGKAGERSALNLVGIEKAALGRGDWLVDPASTTVTARFEADLKLLATEDRDIRTWSPVHLHVGTTRVPARIVLLEGDRLSPGRRALVQIVAERPLPLVFGDLFVIRDTSVERTIGGGHVIDPSAPRRRRRTPARQAVRAALALPDAAEAFDRLLSLPPGVVDFSGFVVDRGLSDVEVDEVLELVEPSLAAVDGRRFAVRSETLAVLGEAIVQELNSFHAEYPDLPGMPLQTLRVGLRTRLTKPAFDAVISLLVLQDLLVPIAGAVRLPSHSSSMRAADQKLWDRASQILESRRFQPPPLHELAEELNKPVSDLRKVCKTMVRMGALIEVRKDRYFLKTALTELCELAQSIARTSPDNTFTAAEFRDQAGCGRAIAIQVLEYFDRRGITGRRGDLRIVSASPKAAFGGEGLP